MDGFLDDFPAQVAILDKDGTILDVNKAWDRFARDNGYRGPSFIGQNYLSLCGGVAGVELSEALAVAQGIKALTKGGDSWFECVYPCHAPTEKRWFKLLLARNADGTMIMAHVNITAEYLKQSFLTHQSFLASTVHDLRTPTNAIRGYAEMLEQGIAPERAREFAHNIVGAADVLLTQINDLLGAAEAENGMLLLSETVIELPALIRECLMQVQHLADKGAVTIVCEFDPLPKLKADPRRLRQALVNLISNAIKYNRQPGRVTVLGRVGANGSITLTVADGGQGMSATEIERALQPFGRTLAAMASGAEGTGLGLPFANHLVSLHDACLSVHSTPGEGTAVTVAFPSWRSMPHDVGSPNADSHGLPEGPSFPYCLTR